MGRLVRILQAPTTTVRSSGGDHSTTAATSNTAESVPAPPPEAVTLESDFVVILAALLCALIGVVGLIAVARCSCLRRGGGGVSQTRTPANKGLKKKVLQSLPKFTYISSSNDGGVGGSSNNNCSKKWMVTSDCAICLAEFQEGDEIRVLPQCGHGFHLGCIDAWLVSHSSCPSCRQILVVPRCQKCGLYPAIAGNGNGGGGGLVVITVDESEMKAGEAGNANEVSATGEGQHQADNDNGENTNSIANDNHIGNSTTFLP